MRYKKRKKSNNILRNILKKFFVQVLASIILVITTLIVFKSSSNIKSIVKENVFEKNFNFASFNNLYKKYFGDDIPFKKEIFKEQSVFSEKLSYNSFEDYFDGVKLTVQDNYLVPVLDDGIVVFKGEKENYGNIVIIQTKDNIDIWYGNLDNINVELYDYVEKGSLLGEVKNSELYLVFQKNGSYLDYNEYINSYL